MLVFSGFFSWVLGFIWICGLLSGMGVVLGFEGLCALMFPMLTLFLGLVDTGFRGFRFMGSYVGFTLGY